jgi:hypothetical protein
MHVYRAFELPFPTISPARDFRLLLAEPLLYWVFHDLGAFWTPIFHPPNSGRILFRTPLFHWVSFIFGLAMTLPVAAFKMVVSQ